MVDKHSAPAFSIGHSTMTQKHNKQYIPGPGAYETFTNYQTTKSRSIKYSEERFKEYGNINPGPGAYNQPHQKDHKQNALILSRPKDHQHERIPGPGAYSPDYNKLVKSMSGFKIGNSQKIADIVGYNRKLPGPGDYQINPSSNKNNAPIMGNSQRSNMILNNYIPGPGQYKQSINEQTILRRQPKVVFGKSGRSMSTHDIIPGPGAYSLASQNKSKSKGFSIKARHQESQKQKSPGPGAYHLQLIDKINHKILSFSMGKAQKLKIDNQKQIMTLPGPQKYSSNNSKYETKNTIIGKEKRLFFGDSKGIPGPGTYSMKFHEKMPEFSIPKSKMPLQKNETPGPGTYDAKLVNQSEYSKIQMNVDNRKPMCDQKEKRSQPGPGAYNFESQKGNGYKIGKEKRPMNLSTVPGPGNYNIPSTIANLPKYQT